MFTRNQYINKECSHKEYYEQFVTDIVLKYVVESIGSKAILNSTDKHLNDIPLIMWDRLYLVDAVARVHNITGYKGGVSLSDQVCVAKAAARMHQEQAKYAQGSLCPSPDHLEIYHGR